MTGGAGVPTEGVERFVLLKNASFACATVRTRLDGFRLFGLNHGENGKIALDFSVFRVRGHFHLAIFIDHRRDDSILLAFKHQSQENQRKEAHPRFSLCRLHFRVSSPQGPASGRPPRVHSLQRVSQNRSDTRIAPRRGR